MSACHLYVVRMLTGPDIKTICSADYPPDVYPNPRTHLTLCGEYKGALSCAQVVI